MTTVRFCDQYIDKRSRTHDQMVQAARSGVQNIAEGSVASGTSKKTELKLTNVARASLEELRLDYEDFLRQRGLEQWARADRRRAGLIALRPNSADEVAAWARGVRNGRYGRDGWDGRDGQDGRGGQVGRGGRDGQVKRPFRPPRHLRPPTPKSLLTAHWRLLPWHLVFWTDN